ncbi:ABC transporter ATP-binding protein [Shouchella sp. 1P09AA]|uniref:ABC transporter ATP-binding protein n=1 Tax=unclassified Shouchella TaxID=2893065 RepID=UPI0039A37388
MIEIKELSYKYENERETVEVLTDVSLTIPKGQWLSIMGPSGSGKTTLIKMLAGLLKPTSGSLFLNDLNVVELNQEERHKRFRQFTSTVYQQFRLLPQFTVLENVMLPLVPYQKKKMIEDKARQMIENVGLSHRLTHFPHQLSGGEQQRTSFARALMAEPALLLCDEPTGNLDTANRDQILSLLVDLHQTGQTIVVATHDDVVANRSNRTILLKDGVIDQTVQLG